MSFDAKTAFNPETGQNAAWEPDNPAGGKDTQQAGPIGKPLILSGILAGIAAIVTAVALVSGVGQDSSNSSGVKVTGGQAVSVPAGSDQGAQPVQEAAPEVVAPVAPVAPAQAVQPQAPAQQPQSQAPAPAPSQPVLSGTYGVKFAVQSNLGNHPADLLSVPTINVLITRDRAIEPNPVRIELTINPTLVGTTQIGPTFDSQGGSFSASATATYRGYTTTWVFQGNVVAGQGLSGTLTIGGDGKLPGGQPIVYSLQGTRQ